MRFGKFAGAGARISKGRSTIGVVTLLFAAVLFLATGVLGFLTTSRMEESLDSVLHTYNVRNELRKLKISLLDLTSRVGTATAADDPTFLSAVPEDLAIQKESLTQLTALTRDNPSQQERISELAPNLNTIQVLLQKCLAGPDCPPGVPAARQEFLRDLSKEQQIGMNLLGRMETEEQDLLTMRLARRSREFRLMVGALAAAFAVGVALLFFNLRLLIKEVDRRRRSESLIRDHVTSYRALSGRVLELQDIERRKIARELHDSVGQYLAGIKLQLNQIERQTGTSTPATKVLFSETGDLIDRSLTEIRTISHLLHPPLLDELGLYSAARWYVEGFAKRSGIQVNFSVDDFVDRLPKDTEVALFRVLQEALTNVHRHSGAKHVTVDVSCKNNVAILTVKDDGHGLPPEVLRRYNEGSASGIGLAGMRERLAELGGTLAVESSVAGTLVRARVATDACRPSRKEPEGVFTWGL